MGWKLLSVHSRSVRICSCKGSSNSTSGQQKRFLFLFSMCIHLILAAPKHQQIRLKYWNGECKPLKAEYALLWLKISSLKAGWVVSHGKQPFVEIQEDSQLLPQFPAAFPLWLGRAMHQHKQHWALQVFGVMGRSSMWGWHRGAKQPGTDLRSPAPQSCVRRLSHLLQAKPSSFSPLCTQASLLRFKNLQIVAPCSTQIQQLSKCREYWAKHAKEGPQAEGCVTSVQLPPAGHLLKGSK